LRREIRVRNFYTRIESDTHGPCELLAPGSESDRVLARHYRRSSAESKPRAHFFERRLITRSLCWLSARSSSRPRSLSATTAALRAARSLPASAASLQSSSTRSCPRSLCGRTVPKVAHRPILSALVGHASNCTNSLARFVGYRDEHRAVLVSLQVIINQRALGRILSSIHLLPEIRIAPPHLIASRLPDIEQKHVINFCLGQFLKCSRIIENVDSTPVRRDDQIVIARMNNDVPYRYRRNVITNYNTMTPAVPRRKYSKLSPAIKQSLHLRVFADDVDVTLRRKIALQRNPRLSEICSLEGPRSEVVVLVPVEGNIRRACVEVRGVDVRHPGVRRQAFDVADDVLPGFAAVLRDLYVAVVGAHPNYSSLHRRFGDREDRAVELCRGVIHDDRPAR